MTWLAATSALISIGMLKGIKIDNLNIVNPHLKFKPGPFYKIMKGFILKVNS